MMIENKKRDMFRERDKDIEDKRGIVEADLLSFSFVILPCYVYAV